MELTTWQKQMIRNFWQLPQLERDKLLDELLCIVATMLEERFSSAPSAPAKPGASSQEFSPN